MWMNAWKIEKKHTTHSERVRTIKKQTSSYKQINHPIERVERAERERDIKHPSHTYTYTPNAYMHHCWFGLFFQDKPQQTRHMHPTTTTTTTITITTFSSTRTGWLLPLFTCLFFFFPIKRKHSNSFSAKKESVWPQKGEWAVNDWMQPFPSKIYWMGCDWTFHGKGCLVTLAHM